MSHTAKIAKLLEQRGWSVAQLADRVGAPQQTVDRYVKRLPKPVQVCLRISEVLGVSPLWLYDDSLGWPTEGPPTNEVTELSAGEVAEILDEVVRRLKRQRPPRDRGADTSTR
jgi:transcriptional regulator with XRE-family HTH domain